MANKEVSDLTAIDVVEAGDEFVANDLTAGALRKVTATQIAAFVAPVASQAEQEAGSDVTKIVSSGRQHFHPSAAKFWVKATGNTTTMVVSYNMTSWANTGTGDADGTIATDFSGVNWAGVVSILDSTSAWDATYTEHCGFNAMDAGTFGVLCARMQDGTTAAASLQHPDSWLVMGFGDQ